MHSLLEALYREQDTNLLKKDKDQSDALDVPTEFLLSIGQVGVKVLFRINSCVGLKVAYLNCDLFKKEV